MFGTAIGYLAMSFISAVTGAAFAVAATFICSLFVNAGNGAVYAMLPLIKRRLTGQIAGIVGAFGNVGGVLFLTLYSFVTPQTFFLAASATALISWGLIYLLVENPKGQIAEEMPDGTVTMIEVA
jgi:MFS transporter, NNP family, nitrate/nitrite transporter